MRDRERPGPSENQAKVVLVQEIVFNKMSFAGDDLVQVRRSWFSLCFKGQASFIFFLGLPFCGQR